MSALIRLGLAVLLAASVLAGAGEVAAQATGGNKGLDKTKGGSVSVATTIAGFGNPPNADKNATGYTNPCTREGFGHHVSKQTSKVKSEKQDIATERPDGEIATIDITVDGHELVGVNITPHHDFKIKYRQWLTACAPDELSSQRDYEPDTTRRYWVGVPTEGNLIQGLLAELHADLPPPEFTWPLESAEHGWIFVNVDNDFRVAPLPTITKTTSASNVLGTASASATATPRIIHFHSGDPDAPPIACPYQAALLPVLADRAQGCSFRYVNSSAIVSHDPMHAFFVARATVHWDITTSGDTAEVDGESWSEFAVQVAEIQAIEVYRAP